MTTDKMVTEVRVWMVDKLLANPEYEALDLAEDTADNFGIYARDNATGEIYAPQWLVNTAKTLVAELYKVNEWIILTKDYLTEERYNEDEVILPKGSAGVIEDIENQFGMILYYVNFGTVVLGVWPGQMANLTNPPEWGIIKT